MTLFEIIITALNLIPILIRNRKSKIIMLTAGILLIALQYLMGQHRWQMLPAYGFAILSLIIVLLDRRIRNPSKWRTFLRASAVLLWLVISAPPLLFPLFKLPAPEGDFSVGTSNILFTDSARLEIYTPEESDYRKYLVQFWYPAANTGDKVAQPYKPHAALESAAFSKLTGFPPFFLNHLNLIRTHSYEDAPVADGKFPVIIFSHGHAFYGARTQNVSLMEELASHGYIVAAIDHPYECMASVLPDGEVQELNVELIRAIQQSITRGTKRDSVISVLTSSSDSVVLQQSFDALMKYNGLFNRSVSIWQGDTGFLLDQIMIMQGQADNRFMGKFDTGKIGIIGMSLGGANAAQSCSKDKRIKAGIDLDGFLYGDAHITGITQPFTFMYSGQNSEMNRHMYKRMTGDVLSLTLKDADHPGFSEFTFFASPFLKRTFSTSKIDPYKCHEIINGYAVLFFDKYLKNKHGDIENFISNYPEITITWQQNARVP